MKLAAPNKLPIANCQLPIGQGKARRFGRIENWKLRIGNESAFTLAEVMAAMLFLAVVIPVAVEVLHVSSLAGEVAVRKGAAARVADRILSESLVTTNWSNGMQSGTVSEGTQDFKWKLSSQSWTQDTMQLLTAEVMFSAQGKDYTVKLSTLANVQNQATPAGTSLKQ
jgi:hypothetical protein